MQAMSDNTEGASSERGAISDAGATLLAAGGLAAAFGAASCCALPMLLGSLGLASAWIGALALLAGPYRPVFLAAAVVGLIGGGLLFRRGRSAITCAPGTGACGRPMTTGFLTGALSLGAVLTVLGFIFA
jgi:mercuric ion transport protein